MWKDIPEERCPKGLVVTSVLFADDVVLLVQPKVNIRHALVHLTMNMQLEILGHVQVQGHVSVMEKTAMLPIMKGETLPLLEEFKYLGTLFTSSGKRQWNQNWTRSVEAVLQWWRSSSVCGKSSSGQSMFPVNLRSHLWSQAMGSDLKNKVTSTGSGIPLQFCWAFL